MATNSENTPARRFEDHHPESAIDWTQPDAPAVPLSSTAGAARQGGVTVHCQEFHELAMDYRGAGFSTAGIAYEALCKYVERLLANAGAPAKQLTDERIKQMLVDVGPTAGIYRDSLDLSFDKIKQFARTIESEVLSAHAGVKAEPAAQVQTALPDWSDAEAALGNGTATPLDIFIYNNEPAGDSDEAHFRAQLQAVLDSVASSVAAPVQAEQAHAAVGAVEPGELEKLRAQVEQLQAMLEDRVSRVPNDDQEWAKVDGAIAFHLIDRHADNWNDAGNMMEAWRVARTASVAAPALPTQAAQVVAVRAAALEEAAHLCECIGTDWLDVGDHNKEYAADYLAKSIRELATKEAAAQVPAAEWISVEDRLPECSMKPDSLGVEVIVYPQPSKGESTAFFGCRLTKQPDFYKYGSRVTGVTHWMPLPAAPSTTTSNDTSALGGTGGDRG